MFASNSHAFTPETLTIHRFVRKLSEQSVKTLLALIDGAEQSLSPNVHQSDTVYSRLQQYKLEARGIRDLLEVPCQPSYIDPCRDSGDVIDAEASTYSDAQERAFSALRSPAGPNSILQNAQGLSKDAQHRLASHEGIQEDLTDQMVSLAGKLKQQAQAQARALHDRDAVLDSASQGLLKSVQGVQAVVKDTKQAVKRTRRSMFFSFFVLLAVAGVFLGVYGFINVTSVTKMFVPYKTMASQWATKTVQGTKHLRQAAEPVVPAPPDPPAADAISGLEVGLVADEHTDVIEPTEDASDEEVLSGFERFGAIDDGYDDAEEPTEPEVLEHAQQVEEQPVHADDPASQESVARGAGEVSEPSTSEEAGAEDGSGASDHPAGEQSGDQELDEEKYEDAEEDEYADEDDKTLTGEAHVTAHHGTAQQEKDHAPEADAQDSSSPEASTDSTVTEHGADAAGVAEEPEPSVVDNEESSAIPAQDDAPQRDVPEPVPAAGGSDVPDTDSSVAASSEDQVPDQDVLADSQEPEEAAQDTDSAEASSPAEQDLDVQDVAAGTEGSADEVDPGPESLPQDDEAALPENGPMHTQATDPSPPEAAHTSEEGEESNTERAEAVVQPEMGATDAAEADAEAPEAINQPDVQSKSAKTASDGMPAQATVAGEDGTNDVVPESAPEAATSVAAGEAAGKAPDTATGAEAAAEPESGTPADMAASAAAATDAASEIAAQAGAGAPDASQPNTDMGAEDAAAFEASSVDPHAAAGNGTDEAGTSNPSAAQGADAASGAPSEAQRPHEEAPVSEAAATAEDEENGDRVDSAQDAGQVPGVEAAGHEDEEDEYLDPKETEAQAAAGEEEEEEDADDEEEENDDEEEEEGQEADKEEEDEYYDPPESSEESPPVDAEEEVSSAEDPLDASEECSASDPSSCSTDDTSVDPKYAREALQAKEWASSAEAGTLGGRDPGGGKFVAGEVGADLSHDASAADSADSTAEPGPASRDEL